MKLVTLHIPETYVDGLEKLVESNLYPNRSEAIRIAIRDLLKRELWGWYSNGAPQAPFFFRVSEIHSNVNENSDFCEHASILGLDIEDILILTHIH